MLLKDTCTLAAEILDGKHDENLAHVVRAAQHRLKITMQKSFRPGSRIRFIDDPRAGDLAGKESTVLKVNKTTIAVGMGEKVIDDFSPDGYFPEGEWRVSPGLVEAI